MLDEIVKTGISGRETGRAPVKKLKGSPFLPVQKSLRSTGHLLFALDETWEFP